MGDRFDNPSYYINRELSWLEFNSRVMMQALNPGNPVFEQMKFLSITSTNLDEFFMIRVASVRDQLHAGYKKLDAAGLTPKKQLSLISRRTHILMDEMYGIYRNSILPELSRNDIRFLHPSELEEGQVEKLSRYFETEIFPVLTPMAVDSSRPFPLILSKSLNIGLLLEGKDDEPVFATVQVPSVLPRLIDISDPDGEGKDFVLLEDVIAMHIGQLFDGRKIIACNPYRITRNADLTFDEEEAEDLLAEIKRSLRMRKWGSVIRLETDYNVDDRLLSVLKKELEVSKDEIYFINGPLNLDFLMKELYNTPGYETLRYHPLVQGSSVQFGEDLDPFELVKQRDILLHHPYQSFGPVVKLLEYAAADPNVLAIKQTLYRVSGHSPVVSALAKAAEAGKQVTVLLEVKARFDEENNIQWGLTLEKAGCHVIYGLPGLKTHSKITLVVRRENGATKRYVHLGTGNYNDVTAKIYTDYGLFTCDEQIGQDATSFFNTLTGYSVPFAMKKLISAPTQLRPFLTNLIDKATDCAKTGKRAEIFIKMNSLVDTELIERLYRASCAGVKIRLLVRGICCLRPDLEGVSENIEVHSIVGRFLEHSRVYYFDYDGQTELYLSSADMMPRNMDRRVELLFPVEDQAIAARILDEMKLYWTDTAQTSVMYEDGTYHSLADTADTLLNAQEILLRRYAGEAAYDE